MIIVYFIVGGSEVLHMQVGFSLRTVLTQLSDDDIIYVVTQTPLLYANLPKVVPILIDEEKIKEWRGTHDFFWRIKIAILRQIAKDNPRKDIMYLDGDTFLYGNFQDVKNALHDGYGLMHKDEGCPAYMKQKSLMMWNTVADKTYGKITIGTQHHMWNAGVVAMPGQLSEEITELALEICDGMLNDGAEPVVVEQYALSIALNECCRHMMEARKWIGHYWHYKYHWSKYVAGFFVKSYRMGYSLDKELEIIKNTNLKYVHYGILAKRTLAKMIGRIH